MRKGTSDHPTDDGIGALLISAFGAGDAGARLQRVCAACARALPVTGAAISVMTDSTARQTVGASDEIAARVEELQFALGSGPCTDAYQDGGPVLVPDLTNAYAGARWPAFAEQAVRRGVQATFAFPLQLGAIRLGVLDLYRDTPGTLAADAITDALTAADVVCLALLGRLGDQEERRDDLAAEWVDRAVLDRSEVHQATGMVMAQLGITADEALSRLRAFAFAEGLLLSVVAAEVVARRLRLEPS